MGLLRQYVSDGSDSGFIAPCRYIAVKHGGGDVSRAQCECLAVHLFHDIVIDGRIHGHADLWQHIHNGDVHGRIIAEEDFCGLKTGESAADDHGLAGDLLCAANDICRKNRFLCTGQRRDDGFSADSEEDGFRCTFFDNVRCGFGIEAYFDIAFV